VRHPARLATQAAYPLLILTMALWGSGLVVARAVHELIPPLALTFWRWLLALLILWPFVHRQLPQAWPAVRTEWRSLAVLTASMLAGSLLSVAAVGFTTATNATLINATQPALTAMAAWLVVRDGLSPRQGLGIALAFVGILVMVFEADLGKLLGLRANIGDLLMLGAVVGWAVYAVQVQRSALEVSGLLLLFLISACATLILLPLYWLEGIELGRDPRTIAAIVYLGGGSTVLAVFLWNLCILSVGANRAAIFVNLMPVFGVALAVLLLGERLAFYHMAGALLVFGGILLGVRRVR
jgi:drug/metabolite transporter (DMT)-like permease